MRIVSLKNQMNIFHFTHLLKTEESKKNLVNYRWEQRFLTANRIVYRVQTGKYFASPGKRVFIKKIVAYNLACVKRGFESGSLVEYTI